jgi:hypothetical protein
VILETMNEKEGRRLQLRNAGNGTAREIRVSGVTAWILPPTFALRAGEVIRIPCKTADDNRTGGAGNSVNLNKILRLVQEQQPSSGAAPEITILFRNVEGAPYFVIERLVHGRLEIIDWGNFNDRGRVVLATKSPVLISPAS